MSQRMTINVPLNRVEGDLEIRAEIEDGTVTNAWCSGNMYRGFENLLIGRGAQDGLVITPRVCGICSTSHLHAAVRALDSIAQVAPPPNALRIRNVTLMAEQLQSDVRHTFLMFAADFANPGYQNQASGSLSAVSGQDGYRSHPGNQATDRGHRHPWRAVAPFFVHGAGRRHFHPQRGRPVAMPALAQTVSPMV
jgi:Ni,Fe-hydrogenase I large subunit